MDHPTSRSWCSLARLSALRCAHASGRTRRHCSPHAPSASCDTRLATPIGCGAANRCCARPVVARAGSTRRMICVSCARLSSLRASLMFSFAYASSLRVVLHPCASAICGDARAGGLRRACGARVGCRCAPATLARPLCGARARRGACAYRCAPDSYAGGAARCV